MLCSRSHFRQVKSTQTHYTIPSAVSQALDPSIVRASAPKNILDGDFIETFLDLPRSRQSETVGKFTFN
jgi:hypothetical protein